MSGWDLDSRPLERESPLITTKPGTWAYSIKLLKLWMRNLRTNFDCKFPHKLRKLRRKSFMEHAHGSRPKISLCILLPNIAS